MLVVGPVGAVVMDVPPAREQTQVRFSVAPGYAGPEQTRRFVHTGEGRRLAASVKAARLLMIGRARKNTLYL